MVLPANAHYSHGLHPDINLAIVITLLTLAMCGAAHIPSSQLVLSRVLVLFLFFISTDVM